MKNVSNNSDKNEILREYLLRAVSDNNLVFTNFFSSAFKSHREGYKQSYTKMLKGFMSGNELTLENIFNDIEKRHPGYKVYQYFDIDTLYAYLKYQEKILEQIRKHAGDSPQVNVRNINYGIDSATEWLHDYKISPKERGYFNGRIQCVKNKNGGLGYAPKKPLTSPEFRDKYNGVDLKGILNSYLIERRTPKIRVFSEISGSQEKNDYIDYKYNGEVLKLKVEEKKEYMTKNWALVTLYKAKSEMGYLEIAIAYDGSIYDGPIYGVGRVLLDDVVAGERFYPSEKYFEYKKNNGEHIKENDKKAETETFAGKPVLSYSDEDQISLI